MSSNTTLRRLQWDVIKFLQHHVSIQVHSCRQTVFNSPKVTKVSVKGHWSQEMATSPSLLETSLELFSLYVCGHYCVERSFFLILFVRLALVCQQLLSLCEVPSTVLLCLFLPAKSSNTVTVYAQWTSRLFNHKAKHFCFYTMDRIWIRDLEVWSGSV